jgi:transcriptional regulator with XRE-family HTH domain
VPPGSDGGRDALSHGLRRARIAADLSGKQAATQSGFPGSKISRIELGRQVATEDDVRILSEVYGIRRAERRQLLELACDVKAENRRVIAARDPAAIQQRIARIEKSSALVREFSPNIIPSLLQSPGYIKTLMETAGWSAEDTGRAITARLERQLLLEEADEPRRWVILLTEGGLGWALGSPEVMVEQMERIAGATYRTNARVGIVPFGRPARVAPLHSWDLYDQRSVVVGTLTNTAILDQPRDIRAYVELTDALEDLAVFHDEARQILARVAERYRAL